ncbi:RNA-binding (RRM/RBD/RNP motifs) family protein isoform X2 [Tasmannia lanceolata]|uniref:RNA-binding (RRM/RBD/RNP motifs) family protein isoform X2 n=1 Tax=Tasmannia lanceolata TaxID=3420 RepID=UPI0040636DDD
MKLNLISPVHVKNPESSVSLCRCRRLSLSKKTLIRRSSHLTTESVSFSLSRCRCLSLKENPHSTKQPSHPLSRCVSLALSLSNTHTQILGFSETLENRSSPPSLSLTTTILENPARGFLQSGLSLSVISLLRPRKKTVGFWREMEKGGAESGTRVFVGGLGGSVTESDLEKTFSSLGTIKGIEIVRTNGRSFAYMDFLPSSEKALSKLFSTYNGCVWKGGRLRLEKAKEHYLVRLRREWAEDAEPIKGKPDALHSDKIKGSSGNSKHMTQEKMQLQIFFPRLRKVKSLPYSGTGKHKYSFQRINVHSLPVHFCDCEEHCAASETSGRADLSFQTQIGVINNEELNIMNSVMNKLFEREDHTEAAGRKIVPAMDGNNSESHIEATGSKIVPTMDGNNSESHIDDASNDEKEATQAEDVDGLVTNIVMAGNDPNLGLMHTYRWGIASADQGSTYSKFQPSNDRSSGKKRMAQERKNISSTNVSEPAKENSSEPMPNKKARATSLLADESNKEELASTKPGKKRSSEIPSEELESSAGAESIGSSLQSNKGVSWVQKSSWKQLVGETGNSSFSISQIMPTIASKKLPKPNDSNVVMSTSEPRPNKKARALSLLASESNVDEFALPRPGKKESSEIHSKKPESRAETQPIGTHQSSKGHSWVQESSWKQLVGETGNSSFSISHILPHIAPEKLPKSSDSDVMSAGNKGQNSVKHTGNLPNGDSSKHLEVEKPGIHKDTAIAAHNSNVETLEKEERVQSGLEGEQSIPKESLQNTSGKQPEKKDDSVLKTSIAAVGIGEVCTFMRSADSEREWTKAKAALSGLLKKKSKEDSTSKNSRGTSSRDF